MRQKEHHNRSYSTEYLIWSNIKRRCLIPEDEFYPRYGGRGITICERWKDSFANFFADMGKRPTSRHTIDRINNNLGYSKNNCRWATYQEQARNRRSTRWITFRGETRCMAEWAEIYGLRKGVLWHRLNVMKWSVEKALLHRKRGEIYGISGCF